MTSPTQSDRTDSNTQQRGELDALVASGDCFITLATELDAASKSAPIDSSAQETMESITRLLLELQRQYRIVKKTADYRQ